MDAEELDEFILGEFGGVVVDSPWEKNPEFVVFRHADNRKWMALRFYASKEQLLRLKPDDEVVLGYEDGARIDIANVKIDPEMVRDVTRMPGVLPAFHMNRKYWVTIVLDKEVDAEKVKPLVEMSYGLTGRKYKTAAGE